MSRTSSAVFRDILTYFSTGRNGDFALNPLAGVLNQIVFFTWVVEEERVERQTKVYVLSEIQKRVLRVNPFLTSYGLDYALCFLGRLIYSPSKL